MLTYTLPGIPHPVSRIAYGCMKIGGTWNASEPITAEDRAAGFAAIEAALAAEINFFDHADIYCRGKSELVFAEYLREHPGAREQMVLQSKCGIRFGGDPHAGDPHRYDFSREHILWSTEQILRRLGIGQLDILLLHRPDCLVEPEEVAAAFDELETSGKVRAFGVSNHTGAQIALLRKCVRQPLIVNQLEVSLTHHGLISEGFLANQKDRESTLASGILDYCRLEDIRIQAWAPVGGGKLLAAPDKLDEKDQGVRKLLDAIAKDHGVSADAILIAWLLRHPAGIQPILGSTRPERIAAGCEADGIKLTRTQWYGLLNAVRGANVP